MTMLSAAAPPEQLPAAAGPLTEQRALTQERPVARHSAVEEVAGQHAALTGGETAQHDGSEMTRSVCRAAAQQERQRPEGWRCGGRATSGSGRQHTDSTDERASDRAQPAGVVDWSEVGERGGRERGSGRESVRVSGTAYGHVRRGWRQVRAVSGQRSSREHVLRSGVCCVSQPRQAQRVREQRLCERVLVRQSGVITRNHRLSLAHKASLSPGFVQLNRVLWLG